MRLVASVIARNEADRYLRPCLDHLLEFCDAVALVDDASTDGTADVVGDYLDAGAPVHVAVNNRPLFDEHEGRARQILLDWTLRQAPTHVLAVDADELVADGPALRLDVERAAGYRLWALTMEEVWEIDGDCLCVRRDGRWPPYSASLLWAVPADPSGLAIADRQLACGRLPGLPNITARRVEVSVLHFGWANPATRQARYDRYMSLDGGRFHDLAHLQSIAAPAELIRLEGRPWPVALEPYRAAVTAAASRPPSRVSC